MRKRTSDGAMLSKQFYRLLPIQILLCLIGAVNGIVSSLFASNYIGAEALSAVALYNPINLFVTAVSTMLVGGAQILCGKYMGQNQVDNTRGVFTLDMVLSGIISAVIIAVMVLGALTGATRVFTADPTVLHIFNQYLLGMAIGIAPLMFGNQFAAFLSLENKTRLTIAASVIYIVANILLNFVFVGVMHMGAFGLALASSLGLWIYFAVQGQYFLSGKSLMRFDRGQMRWSLAGKIAGIGIPGAASNAYQAVRGVIVNLLIVKYVGELGLSAFGAGESVLRLFWAVPSGMAAVLRMLMSVSYGEEDRKSLCEEMRIGLIQCPLVQLAISCGIIALAVPFTHMFFRDPAAPVYDMTVWYFRLLPLCMPLSVIYLHFVTHAQVAGKQLFVHIMSLLDGVVCVSLFSLLLIKPLGMKGVYIASTLNGLVTLAVAVLWAWAKKKRFPHRMEELMVMDDDFGAAEDASMDVSLRSAAEVSQLSERVQRFCMDRGVDQRRSYLAGLFLEEMTANVVEHGFTKDRKKHSADVRVVHKDDTVILRIKDDCVPFDPAERQSIVTPEDPTKNIGIRMVYAMAEDIKYQNILGLNVLTIRI